MSAQHTTRGAKRRYKVDLTRVPSGERVSTEVEAFNKSEAKALLHRQYGDSICTFKRIAKATGGAA